MSNNKPNVAKKSEANLTSVTPVPPPVAGPEIDTTTPVDITVQSFTQKDTKWYPWALNCMQNFWPHLHEINYAGIFAQLMAQNGVLWIRTKRALLLAVSSREPIGPRPIVDILYCFKHDPEDQTQDKDVRLLFRRVDDWAKGQGASEVRILYPDRIDGSFSRTKESMSGDEKKILIKEIV